MPSLLTRIGRTIRKKLGMGPTFREKKMNQLRFSKRPTSSAPKQKKHISALRSASATVSAPKPHFTITANPAAATHRTTVSAPTKFPKPPAHKPWPKLRPANVAVSGPGRTSQITAKMKSSSNTSRTITAKAPSTVKVKGKARAKAQVKSIMAGAGGKNVRGKRKADLLKTVSYMA